MVFAFEETEKEAKDASPNRPISPPWSHRQFGSYFMVTQTRLAANLAGDTWEPSIAADRHGHVYVLIPDFPPSCKKCPSSINYLVVSNDNGKTWSTPRIIADPGSGQIDVQLKVDPVDGKTVYASW